MTQQVAAQSGVGCKGFLSRHRGALALFISAGILLCVGAVYVFAWFTGQAQTTNLVPSNLGLWSMGNVVMFILNAIFWELLLVGIPAAVGAVVGWLWWRNLPEEEKAQYRFGKSSRSRNAGGAISPLLFIAFALKVYFDGNWNAAISTWTLNYVVGSIITILVWVAAIFAVPAAVGFAWWMHRELKKP
jgi:magnesium-transporting ATPase (P-type)